MKNSIRKAAALLLCMALMFAVTACGSDQSSAGAGSASADAEASEWASLEGQTLMIYCGAGMKKPAEEITAAFKEATGCDVQVTFGNAAQIVSQITTSDQGDLFIAGAEGELKPLKEKDYIAESRQLVKHIPVVAVPKGNPAGIESIEDLKDAKLVLADAESTPIGKVADAVLSDAGILESANIIARTTTAPEIITAMGTGECEASIVWKENAAVSDEVEILDIEKMADYIKIVPAASLKCSENSDALAEFLEYLDSEEAHSIWTKYGYELV